MEKGKKQEVKKAPEQAEKAKEKKILSKSGDADKKILSDEAKRSDAKEEPKAASPLPVGPEKVDPDAKFKEEIKRRREEILAKKEFRKLKAIKNEEERGAERAHTREGKKEMDKSKGVKKDQRKDKKVSFQESASLVPKKTKEKVKKKDEVKKEPDLS